MPAIKMFAGMARSYRDSWYFIIGCGDLTPLYAKQSK